LFILSKTNLQGVLLMKPWFARKFHPWNKILAEGVLKVWHLKN
jgi:hypothetical protein